YGLDEECLIFGYHTHLSPRTMQHAFERYIKAANIKKINIHALRHSHVFMLRQSGFDAFDIAKRLGHSVEMVNEYYGQWFLERQREMVKTLNDLKLDALKNEENQNSDTVLTPEAKLRQKRANK
ncbi:MAG: tyrosine-type recombinase/integrase, partial [Erysipelotrichaceae bacterium]